MRRVLAILLAGALLLSPAAVLAEGTISTRTTTAQYTLPLDLSPGMPLIQANYLSEWHYKDPTIEMIAREEHIGEGRYWIAEVQIEDASQLRTMPSNSFEYSSHAEGRRISRRANAVLACDGDFWWREVSWKGNYVLRQGTLFMYDLNGHSDVLLIDEDGDFHIIHKATNDTVPLADEATGRVMYEGKQIFNGLCFGPALVENGIAQTIEPDDHMITEKTPARLALCQLGKLRYAVICSYARSGNLQDFANLLASLGVETAYNLDGGDSTMMFTGSTMINRNGSIREIGDIVYFASAWPEGE